MQNPIRSFRRYLRDRNDDGAERKGDIHDRVEPFHSTYVSSYEVDQAEEEMNRADEAGEDQPDGRRRSLSRRLRTMMKNRPRPLQRLRGALLGRMD